MTKKRPISADEESVFHNAMKDVEPLKQDKHKPTTKPSAKSRRPIKQRSYTTEHTVDQPYAASLWLENLAPGDWLEAEDLLHFARSGLQHKLLQRMQRGQIDIEAHIDLHRQTTEEAMNSVNQFIDTCIAQRKRWVCIIHGKGHFSPQGKPILKNFLNQWLRSRTDVLAFHSAKPKHGGTGALYVLLKGKRYAK